MRVLFASSKGPLPMARSRMVRTATRVVRKVRGVSFERRSEVSVIFLGKRAMRRLNRTYRRKDRPTDVLSFPLLEGVGFPTPSGELRCLGDVVICPDVAARQARERGGSTRGEIEMLLVHGLLHLLGYDHASRAQERKMFALQASFLSPGGRKGRA